MYAPHPYGSILAIRSVACEIKLTTTFAEHQSLMRHSLIAFNTSRCLKSNDITFIRWNSCLLQIIELVFLLYLTLEVGCFRDGEYVQHERVIKRHSHSFTITIILCCRICTIDYSARVDIFRTQIAIQANDTLTTIENGIDFKLFVRIHNNWRAMQIIRRKQFFQINLSRVCYPFF